MGRPALTPRGDYGRHLVALREAAGLTQQQLADQLGVHPSNVGFWERAAKPPRGDVLAALAEALGVSMDELMRTAPPKPKPAPKGRLHEAFTAAAKLPRRQQQKIVEVVEALLKAS
jgi:transcriptional regulator with XRE-family HTH domain